VELGDNSNWSIILGFSSYNQIYCKNINNFPSSIHFDLIFIELYIGLLLCCNEQAKKNKKLFWVAAISPMICVIVSTFSVYITRADKKGVAIVSSNFLL
jgi:hypothetical protein